MSNWQKIMRRGANIIIVSADTTQKPDYAKLSDALVAISDASATKRYTIVVIGDIADTSQCIAKSYIDVVGVNARITVTTNSNVHGIIFDDMSNSVWDGIEIVRAGTVTATHCAALAITGTTDSSVILRNFKITSDLTYVSCHALYIIEQASPIIENFVVTGALSEHSTGTYIGQSVGSDADPYITAKITNLISTSRGNSGDNNSGIIIDVHARPTLHNCKGYASESAAGQGISIQYTGAPILYACSGFGAESAVVDSSGIYIDASAAPTLIGCRGVGRGAAAGCNGIVLAGGCKPILIDCVGIQSPWHTSTNALYILHNASPEINGGYFGPESFSYEWYYDSADSGRFRPFASHPYILVGIEVWVLVANAGVTLSVGKTAGGTQIINALDISTTGAKVFDFVPAFNWANGYLYATPSGAIGANDVKIRYIVSSMWDTCYGLKSSTYGDAQINGATIVGNGHSTGSAIYIGSGAPKSTTLKSCDIRSLNPGVGYAIVGQASMTGEQVTNCAVSGLLSNVTGIGGKNGGVASVADGGTIAHGLGATPTKYGTVGTVANEIVSATADATNMTVAIKKPADGSAGTTQSVAWWAER